MNKEPIISESKDMFGTEEQHLDAKDFANHLPGADDNFLPMYVDYAKKFPEI